MLKLWERLWQLSVLRNFPVCFDLKGFVLLFVIESRALVSRGLFHGADCLPWGWSGAIVWDNQRWHGSLWYRSCVTAIHNCYPTLHPVDNVFVPTLPLRLWCCPPWADPYRGLSGWLYAEVIMLMSGWSESTLFGARQSGPALSARLWASLFWCTFGTWGNYPSRWFLWLVIRGKSRAWWDTGLAWWIENQSAEYLAPFEISDSVIEITSGLVKKMKMIL